jgi:hypothetical protein
MFTPTFTCLFIMLHQILTSFGKLKKFSHGSHLVVLHIKYVRISERPITCTHKQRVYVRPNHVYVRPNHVNQAHMVKLLTTACKRVWIHSHKINRFLVFWHCNSRSGFVSQTCELTLSGNGGTTALFAMTWPVFLTTLYICTYPLLQKSPFIPELPI